MTGLVLVPFAILVGLIVGIVVAELVLFAVWLYEGVIWRLWIWLGHVRNRRDVLRNPERNDLSAIIIRAQERFRISGK